MKKVFILLVVSLLGGGSFGEVSSNALTNGATVYGCGTLPIEMVFVKRGTLQNKNTIGAIAVGDFYIGKYEVTQKLWREVMGSYPIAPIAEYGEGDNYPMYFVNWDDAQAFIDSLNVLYGNGKFRLPTEAEWEYAAKGGSSQQSYVYSGSDTVDNVAWWVVNAGTKAHAVGTKAANSIGIYDMSGNVREWCQDWFDDSFGESAIPILTPTSGSYRVVRGGYWFDHMANNTVFYRSGSIPGNRSDAVGFRLAYSSNP